MQNTPAAGVGTMPADDVPVTPAPSWQEAALWLTGLATGVVTLWLSVPPQLALSFRQYFLPGIGAALVLLSAARLWTTLRAPAVAADGMVDGDARAWVALRVARCDAQARSYLLGYRLCRIPSMVAAASIPVVAAAAPAADGSWRLACAALGGFIAVLEGVQQLCRFHEGWMTSVATRESLQLELMLHDAKAGPYMADDRDAARARLARRAAAVVGREGPGAAPTPMRPRPVDAVTDAATPTLPMAAIAAPSLMPVNGNGASHDRTRQGTTA